MTTPVQVVAWPPDPAFLPIGNSVTSVGVDGTPRAIVTEGHPGSVSPAVQIAYGVLSVAAFLLADDAEDLADDALDAARDLADRVCAVEEERANKWLANQATNEGLIGELLGAGAPVLSCSSTQNIINGCMTALGACLRAGSHRQVDRYGISPFNSCDRTIELEATSSANDGIQQMIRHNNWRQFKLSSFTAEQAARAQSSAIQSSRTSNGANLLNLAIGNYNAIYQVASGAVSSFVSIGSAALGSLAASFD